MSENNLLKEPEFWVVRIYRRIKVTENQDSQPWEDITQTETRNCLQRFFLPNSETLYDARNEALNMAWRFCNRAERRKINRGFEITYQIRRIF